MEPADIETKYLKGTCEIALSLKYHPLAFTNKLFSS